MAKVRSSTCLCPAQKVLGTKTVFTDLLKLLFSSSIPLLFTLMVWEYPTNAFISLNL